MTRQTGTLQDNYLNALRCDKIQTVIYLVNGFQLRGIVRAFDPFTVVLESDGQQMMIYKHAISTVTPAQPLDLAALQKEALQ